MRGVPISKKEIQKIIHLRQTGHSLPEIRKAMNKGSATVFKYIQGVEVFSEYRDILKEKQGGSRARSRECWSIAKQEARKILLPFTKRDPLLILALLYWGEGTKKEFNVINSDPDFIRVFVNALESIGVRRGDLRVTLRIYEDINEQAARKYWSGVLSIKSSQIQTVNILKGRKVGKLQYGMCRIRVTKGGKHFKLIMSMIELIKSNF